jgi:tRNA G10  N-methylase Trm11
MSDLKRKCVVLSIQQKLEIIEQLEKSRNAKQLALQFGIGEQTVHDLEKKKNKLISFASSSSSSGMKSRKTMKKSIYEDLDKAMLV